MGNLPQTLEKQAFAGDVDRVENVEKQDCPYGQSASFGTLVPRGGVQKYIHNTGAPLKALYCGYCGYCYKPSSLSPILKISPAPIVINRSSGSQFSNKNISIASKDGK